MDGLSTGAWGVFVCDNNSPQEQTGVKGAMVFPGLQRQGKVAPWDSPIWQGMWVEVADGRPAVVQWHERRRWRPRKDRRGLETCPSMAQVILF